MRAVGEAQLSAMFGEDCAGEREAEPGTTGVFLVKPQFEVGREQVGKGGVVREPELRAQAVDDVRRAAAEHGWQLQGEAQSQLPGPKGNLEVFLWVWPEPAEKAEET